MEDVLNERFLEAQQQIDECDCEGSMSKPWLFCDDCQTARTILDQEVFDDGKDEDREAMEAMEREEII